MEEAARIEVGVRSCGTAVCYVLISAARPAGVAVGQIEVLSTGTGGGIVGSVVWLDVATPASVVVMEAYGVTGAAGSYFWSCLLQCARCKAQGRRSTGTGPSAPTLPVADEDGARR